MNSTSNNKNQQQPHSDSVCFLEGGGEMGALTRAHNWASSPLGPVHAWPDSLRTTLGILLNSRFPMFLFWGPEHICFYNDAYRPSLGNEGKHPGALGRPGTEVWPEVWHILQPLIDDVFAGKEAQWFEDRLVPIYRNGRMEDVYWSFSYSPVKSENGQVSGVLVVCTETTAHVIRKHEDNQKMHFAIEAAELITWDYNVVGNLFTANERYATWFGLPYTEYFDMNDTVAIVAEEDRDRVLDAFMASLNSDSVPYDVEYTIRPNGLPERVLRAKGKVKRNEEGMALRFSGTIQDVTQQARARQQIKDSEERFRIMADAAPNIVWALNPDGSLRYMNKYGLEFLGISLDELMLHSWKPYMHPDDLLATTLNVSPAIYNNQLHKQEMRLRSKQGEYRWFLSQGAPSYYSNGELYGYVGSGIDITERKKAEEALALNNMLLTQTNNDLDNFIYTASHDLKSPISNIEGLLQALLRTLPAESLESERAHRITSLMQDSVERFKKTIGNLTEVVKLQKEYSEDARSVQLARVIQEVQLDLDPLIQSTNATLAIDTDACPAIYFTEKNLRSIIYNLVSNGIKYSRPGGTPHISIRSQSIPGYCQLIVSDNGLGIAKGKIGQLFTMFKRFHDHVEGSGIGLYIVKKIIDNAGGYIEVESTVGEGTTFAVYFPR
jgi:PAS domain S-box-containing protein